MADLGAVLRECVWRKGRSWAFKFRKFLSQGYKQREEGKKGWSFLLTSSSWTVGWMSGTLCKKRSLKWKSLMIADGYFGKYSKNAKRMSTCYKKYKRFWMLALTFCNHPMDTITRQYSPHLVGPKKWVPWNEWCWEGCQFLKHRQCDLSLWLFEAKLTILGWLALSSQRKVVLRW